MFDQGPNEQANISGADVAILKAIKLQLAACQAENLKLRGIIESFLLNADYCRRDGREALATPPGDMAALREVIARVLEEANTGRTPYFAKMIRSGEWTPEILK